MQRKWIKLVVALALLSPIVALAAGGGGDPENNLVLQIAVTFFQLGVILAVAKLSGEFCQRFLRIPAVLGELLAGVAIGPYAFGKMIPLGHGALFSLDASSDPGLIPVSTQLYTLAQFGSITLLFTVGLETDLKKFLKYAVPATAVAIGGIVFPFLFGVVSTVWLGYATGYMDPVALFVGTIMTATSVGITARVLSDLGKLSTAEGVTILGGAVVDDVLGILVLAIVIALSRSMADGTTVSVGTIAVIGFKAVGFWLGLTVVGLLLSKPIEKFLNWFKLEGSALSLALALCLMASAAAEFFGLAMIIGAYAMGLSLSGRGISHTLQKNLEPLNQVMVPVFFVVMGMLVDLQAMTQALGFAVLLTVLAIISKVFGCGIPALMTGFNRIGATRIGIGMLPRGEVALIVAGVGLANKIIDSDVFGVSVMMTFVTTLIAPIVLVPLFKTPTSGLRKPDPDESPTPATGSASNSG